MPEGKIRQQAVFEELERLKENEFFDPIVWSAEELAEFEAEDASAAAFVAEQAAKVPET